MLSFSGGRSSTPKSSSVASLQTLLQRLCCRSASLPGLVQKEPDGLPNGVPWEECGQRACDFSVSTLPHLLTDMSSALELLE